jgi:methylenetetrahydrofolate dehydrogenase (NADP+)/methenyltetrahydrofolate cyclohydrolase
MQLIDGKSLANKIHANVATEVEKLKQEQNIVPGLAVILVGDDPASHAYVKMKARACEKVGFYSITHNMPESITQDEIMGTIEMINANPRIDGILVQIALEQLREAFPNKYVAIKTGKSGNKFVVINEFNNKSHA